MLAQALRQGSGYGGCSGSVVGGCWACGRGDSSVGGGSSGSDFAFGRQRPGELQQRLPVLGDGGKEGHHKLRIRTLEHVTHYHLQLITRSSYERVFFMGNIVDVYLCAVFSSGV